MRGRGGPTSSCSTSTCRRRTAARCCRTSRATRSSSASRWWCSPPRRPRRTCCARTTCTPTATSPSRWTSKSSSSWSSRSTYSGSPWRPCRPMASSPDTRPVVLCVDDAKDLLALMGKALGEDYRVITADNGGDAISAAFGEPRPDLILLDIDMPEVSGLEVCQALKGEAQTASIPVVFLTARTGMQEQVEGLEQGAVDYITKPFNAFVLRARVRIHIALANQRYELERLV